MHTLPIVSSGMKNNPYERQIYDFIVGYQALNGYPPSANESGDHIGKSGGNVWRYLKQMRARGLVDWQYKRPRTIRVIAPFR
jgi:SOS-response transcriptional repressor LexA